MAKVHKISSRIGGVANTMYSLSAEIKARRPQLAEVLKSIEQEYHWIVNNTLTSNQICEELGITIPTLIKRRNAGLIPYVKFGRDFYYLKPEDSLCSK